MVCASYSIRATAKFITAGSFFVPPSPVRFSLNSDRDRNAVKKCDYPRMNYCKVKPRTVLVPRNTFPEILTGIISPKFHALHPCVTAKKKKKSHTTGTTFCNSMNKCLHNAAHAQMCVWIYRCAPMRRRRQIYVGFV